MHAWIGIVLLLYGISFTLHLLRRARLGVAVFVLAGCLNIGVVGVDWIAAGQPPFNSMRQVMVLLGASALPAYVALVLGRGLRWMRSYFPVVAAIPLGCSLIFEQNAAWHLMPALQSPWFVPHVIAYMASYFLALMAFLMFIASQLRRDDADRLETGSYEVISVAFPLMTFGLFSGALWADSVWGGYWSWDPKETWALITWTLYLVYFHCRRTPRLRAYANAAHVIAFLALLATFLLVNLLPKLSSKLHSYV